MVTRIRMIAKDDMVIIRNIVRRAVFYRLSGYYGHYELYTCLNLSKSSNHHQYMIRA